MITIIFALACLTLIAKLLNDKWKLEKSIDKLCSRLAFAGKNYIQETSRLKKRLLYKQSVINSHIRDLRKLTKENTDLERKEEHLYKDNIDLKNKVKDYQEANAERINYEVLSSKRKEGQNNHSKKISRRKI